MAIEIAIDTNRYRDFADGVPQAVREFQRSPKIHVPLIVIGALRAGFALGRRGAENQRVFEQFLHRPRVNILVPSAVTATHYAALLRTGRKNGMNAEEFEKKFDEGQEEIIDDLDLTTARRVNQEQKQNVNEGGPSYGHRANTNPDRSMTYRSDR